MNKPQADPAFHCDELQRRCLSNDSLVRRVVESFLTSGAETLNQIKDLAAAQDWEQLTRAAHRLKGASDNVAAPRLRQLAALIEEETRRGSTEVEGPITMLSDEWTKFETDAQEFLGSKPVPQRDRSK